MKILNKRQILLLHKQLIDETGGSHGLRDEGLLESALASLFRNMLLFHRIRLFSKRRPGSDTT